MRSAYAPAQITSGGSAIQEKNPRITIEGLLDRDGESASIRARHGGLKTQAAYLHVPFCFHKCHYCDFYSIVDRHDRQEAFVDRLIGEIEAASGRFDEPMQTIFVGGGTPTLLATDLWKRLLRAVHRYLRLDPGLRRLDGREFEFTVEANPETVTAELADALVSGGVNRVSMGAQSFNPAHLKTLERWHDPASVGRSVAILRAAGISNINLDLIFAIPGQSIDQWLADLDAALALQPTHLSCYSLMYEPNTPLTMKMKAGQIEPIDQDVEAAMFEATIDRLANAGFEHYEISNWAKSAPHARSGSGGANRCRHNMLYWTNANWWPFGPSASGHVNGLRWKNVPRLGEYLDHGPFPSVVDVEQLDEDGRIGEAFMLGLRLIEGMELTSVEALLQGGERGTKRRASIESNIEIGLLERAGNRLLLTRRGLMLADTVLAPLI